MCIQGPLERAEERLGRSSPTRRDAPSSSSWSTTAATPSRRRSSPTGATREPAIRLVEAGENVQRALGSNLGLAAGAGAVVVFLGEEVEVAPEWLRPLVRPLQDPAVMGAQPKILAPDGSIDGAGLVFAAESAFPYPLYAGLPGDFEPRAAARARPRSAGSAPPSAPPTSSGPAASTRSTPPSSRTRTSACGSAAAPGLRLRARRRRAPPPRRARPRGAHRGRPAAVPRALGGAGAGGRRGGLRPRRAAGAAAAARPAGLGRGGARGLAAGARRRCRGAPPDPAPARSPGARWR